MWMKKKITLVLIHLLQSSMFQLSSSRTHLFPLHSTPVLSKPLRLIFFFNLTALHLVLGLFLFLNKPVLLDSGLVAGSSLALNVHGHALVLLDAAGEVGLFGRLGGGRDLEFENLALGVGGLDSRALVASDFREVEVLDEVGWEETC